MSAQWIIVGARLFQFASTLVLFGSSLFYLYGFGVSSSGTPLRWAWPWRVLLIAAMTAFASTIFWVMGQTAMLTDDPKSAIDPASLWLVLSDTRIGRICLLRFGVIALSIATLFSMKARPWALWSVQAVLGGVLVASFAWSGHGARDQGWPGLLHLGGDVLHLLTAGVWIGALVPLGVLILHSHRAQSEEHARAAHVGLISFSGIGLAVVALLVLTGLINSWFLIGPSHWRALLTTAYGISLIVKLGLFGLMLLLAAANRFRLTPQLHIVLAGDGSMAAALRSLRTSVVTETVLALLVLGAVAFLGTLAPPVSSG